MGFVLAIAPPADPGRGKILSGPRLVLCCRVGTVPVPFAAPITPAKLVLLGAPDLCVIPLPARTPIPAPTVSGDLNLPANLASEFAIPVSDLLCRLAKVGAVSRPLVDPVDARDALSPPPWRIGSGKGRNESCTPKANDIREKLSDASDSLSESDGLGSMGDMGFGLSPLRMRLIL